jgi:hypothetical protein
MSLGSEVLFNMLLAAAAAAPAAAAAAAAAEDNSLNYAAILDTAADIARAMMHLHKNQVRPDAAAASILMGSKACLQVQIYIQRYKNIQRCDV